MSEQSIEDAQQQAIDEMNRHYILAQGEVFRLDNNPEKNGRIATPIRWQNFRRDKESEPVPVLTNDGKVVNQNKADFWVKHPDIRKFPAGIDFRPEGKKSPDVFNLYDPHHLGNLSDAPDIDPSRTYYDAHIWRHVAKGDKAVYRYVWDWLADLVQNPARSSETRTALVFKGDHGTGKGYLVRPLQHYLGPYSLETNNEDVLNGNYNSQVEGRLLVFADELYINGMKGQNKFKKLVTGDNIEIYEKYMSPRSVSNCTRWVLATNHELALKLEPTERRFFVVTVETNNPLGIGLATSYPAMDWFEAAHKELEDEKVWKAIVSHLKERDLTQPNGEYFHPQKHLPDTQSVQVEREHGMSAALRWWKECLETGVIVENDDAVIGWQERKLPKKLTYEAFRDWERKHTTSKYPTDKSEWLNQLRKVTPQGYFEGNTRKARCGGLGPKWVYDLPPIKDARAEWQHQFNIPLMQAEEEESLSEGGNVVQLNRAE
jgi:hypothetical protein